MGAGPAGTPAGFPWQRTPRLHTGALQREWRELGETAKALALYPNGPGSRPRLGPTFLGADTQQVDDVLVSANQLHHLHLRNQVSQVLVRGVVCKGSRWGEEAALQLHEGTCRGRGRTRSTGPGLRRSRAESLLVCVALKKSPSVSEPQGRLVGNTAVGHTLPVTAVARMQLYQGSERQAFQWAGPGNRREGKSSEQEGSCLWRVSGSPYMGSELLGAESRLAPWGLFDQGLASNWPGNSGSRRQAGRSQGAWEEGCSGFSGWAPGADLWPWANDVTLPTHTRPCHNAHFSIPASQGAPGGPSCVERRGGAEEQLRPFLQGALGNCNERS